MAEATHTVIVGEVTRVLPVREVKEGLSVALFNPLGDWELNEALGVELTPLIPAGTSTPDRTAGSVGRASQDLRGAVQQQYGV